MSELSDLLACLSQQPAGAGQTSLDATEQETSDALWLAVQMRAGQARNDETWNEPPGPPRLHRPAEIGDQLAQTPGPAADPGVALRHRSDSQGQGEPADGDALPIRLPEVTELRQPLELQRALRPLKRMVRAGIATALDEEATVRCSADAGAVLPVWKRSSQRWLSLALVIDVSPSMILWRNLVGELHTLLAQIGAFRGIRAWELRLDGGSAAIAPPGSTIAHRSPRELVDPTGRQAILVVTDCVHQAWQPDGVALDVVGSWARTGPLALLQPLEQRMWWRSSTPSWPATLRSPEPGASNERLIASAGHLGERPSGVPIPILEINPDWLADWARLVCADGPVDVVATVAGIPAGEVAAYPVPSPDDGDARRAVERFMAAASPDAFRLAGLLAEDDVPLTLPLMRHIQRAMVPDSRPLQLAEVFLGGLLGAMTPDQAAGPPDVGDVSFAFPADVREVLRGTIRRSEAKRVRDCIRAEFSTTPAVSQRGVPAMIPAAPGTAGTPATGVYRSYAKIDSSAVAARGGDYAAAALAQPDVTEAELLDDRPTRAARFASRPVAWEVSRQFSESDRTFSVTMLGAPASGKTTFLAALSIALAHQESDRPSAAQDVALPAGQDGPGTAGERESWRIHGSDAASTTALVRFADDLTESGTFPEATLGIDRVRFQLVGRVSLVERRWAIVRQRPGVLKISLDLADVAGGVGISRLGDTSRGDLIEALTTSRAIIFVFDPVSELERGDFFRYIFGVLAELAQRMLAIGALGDGVLPHYVSVCIAKFDDVRVFRTAETLGLITYDEDDPYLFPRVHDDDARYFSRQLGRSSRHGNTSLALNTIERYFRPERVKYFVTSSVGFYVDPVTRSFDRDDGQNVIANGGGSPHLRGSIHPINVAEPVLWLTRKLVEAGA